MEFMNSSENKLNRGKNKLNGKKKKVVIFNQCQTQPKNQTLNLIKTRSSTVKIKNQIPVLKSWWQPFLSFFGKH